MPISQILLPEFDEEMKNTRKMLERVPDGKFDYRPHPKSMTLGQVASHVADAAGWASVTLDSELLELTPDTKPFYADSQAALVESFDRNVKGARERIERATDSEWAKIWTLKMGGQTFLSMPRAAVMRSMVMNHLIHHRGQLGVYLRLNDVAVPGMYGPSADESGQ